MKITRMADYAVRVVLELAATGTEGRVRGEDVGDRHSVPRGVMTRILARLAACGIADTRRGAGGGVKLAKPPSEISLLEVVEAIDGPVELNRCTRRPGECPRDSFCAIHPVWLCLQSDFRERLHSIRFDALAASASGSLICPGKEPTAELTQMGNTTTWTP